MGAEDGPDHHRAPRSLGQPLVPGQIGHPLRPPLQQCGIGHGEQPGAGAFPEHGGQGQQLVFAAHLTGQRRPTRSGVPHHLVGRETEGAQL